MAEKTQGRVLREYLAMEGLFLNVPTSNVIAAIVITHIRPQIEREARACAVEDVIKRFKAIGFLGTEALKELAPLPSGYCVVPLEPDDTQIKAAYAYYPSNMSDILARGLYKAMIKARAGK